MMQETIPPVKTIKKIAIIGSGFAGIATYIGLKRTSLYQQGLMHVDLYDKRSAFEYTPAIHEILGGVHPSRITTPFSLLIPRKKTTRFFQREIQDISTFLQEYDGIVLATGSSPKFFDDSMKRYARTVRSVHDVQSLYHDISQNSIRSIHIVGGGYVGVEVASVLAQRFPNKSITVVHGGSRFLETLPFRASNLVEKFFKRYSVQYRFNTFVSKVSFGDTGYVLEFKSGETCATDLVIATTGVSKDIVDGIKNIESLVIQDNPLVVTVGDSRVKSHPDTAHNAIVEGTHIAQIIHDYCLGRDPKLFPRTYAVPESPLIVALGLRDGFLTYKHIIIPMPYIAGFFKRCIQYIVINMFKRKLR